MTVEHAQPGTSPTRIMGEIGGCCKKYLQIEQSPCRLIPSQSLGFCGGFPRFGREVESLPNPGNGYLSQWMKLS